MKLWKVRIKTYHFGIHFCELFVLANTENSMLRTTRLHPLLRKDEDAVIESYKEIDLTNTTNRVL